MNGQNMKCLYINTTNSPKLYSCSVENSKELIITQCEYKSCASDKCIDNVNVLIKN